MGKIMFVKGDVSNMKTVLVIPVYNEAERIGAVLERARFYVDEVVVVDDGSSDDSSGVISGWGGNIKRLRHRVNLGKGAALKTGCEAACLLGADLIITIDGDGQHPPEYIPGLLDYLLKNNLEFVFTARRGGQQMPLIRKLGNGVLSWVARRLFNLKVQDIWCGLRAFRASCLPKIYWTKSDYSGEIQMALKVGRKKLNYGQYLIPAVYEDNSVKGVHILHGLKLLAQMVAWRIML